jgi:putative transposase
MPQRNPVLTSLQQARATIQTWKKDYDQHRPHSALGNRTPMECVSMVTLETRAA